ncbi:gamma-glutamylcyclotransferase family protein [Pleurocapsa sp. FMAR1]|uniref:gamma-glutamylcyclotransferase family protein n=1 Tax=Pleurocapsa sp. FMAR1 TaxID=3040204 RepID=UPI0029C8E039|nr:gamma-glutamylcyclotransferase [Pleurocapsa sp. FMAR1]
MKSDSLTLNVFVYGTLKPGEANFAYYCLKKLQKQIPAYTWGNLYALPVAYPAMTTGENKVRGILLTFSDPSVLNSLDRLEGYQPGRDSSLNEYYRQLVDVYSLDNRFLGKAWAYFMTVDRVKHHRGTIIISGWWTGDAALD